MAGPSSICWYVAEGTMRMRKLANVTGERADWLNVIFATKTKVLILFMGRQIAAAIRTRKQSIGGRNDDEIIPWVMPFETILVLEFSYE